MGGVESRSTRFENPRGVKICDDGMSRIESNLQGPYFCHRATSSYAQNHAISRFPLRSLRSIREDIHFRILRADDVNNNPLIMRRASSMLSSPSREFDNNEPLSDTRRVLRRDPVQLIDIDRQVHWVRKGSGWIRTVLSEKVELHVRANRRTPSHPPPDLVSWECPDNWLHRFPGDHCERVGHKSSIRGALSIDHYLKVLRLGFSNISLHRRVSRRLASSSVDIAMLCGPWLR